MSDDAIRPKLVLDGARAALDWYAGVLSPFGAVVGQVFTDGPDGERVVHADLTVLGAHLSLKDADDVDPVPTPGPILEVVLDEPDPWEAAFLDGGATSVFPVADQPYGARAGRVRDPFGVQWLLTTPVT